MNVRRFRAPNITEALSQVRKALGEEAVILRTRKVKRGGVLSFLQKELIEVVAASPDRDVIDPARVTDQSYRMRRTVQALPPSDLIRDLKDDVGQLKGDVHALVEQFKFDRMPSLPYHLVELYKQMVMSGIHERIAKDLTQSANIKLTGDELDDGTLVRKTISAMLKSRLKFRKPPRTLPDRAKIIALIGPTGVGKTTTLAKLVTSYRYWGKNDTALVSADTYRVAAIEQLKTFASIAGIPMEAVYQPGSLQNVLSRHRNRDAVFIDTAGRSQADTKRLEELGSFLETAESDEVLLCLSISTRLEEQLDIIKRYLPLKPTGVIFTKLDETIGPGMIFSVLSAFSIPLTYLTCGQNVPDDILTVEPDKLIKLLLDPELLENLKKTHFESWIAAETETLGEETLAERPRTKP